MNNTAPLSLSRISAGTWKLVEWKWTTHQIIDWIERCVEWGITTFDHADIYGSYLGEIEFGHALKRFPYREKLQLVSKCGIKLVSPQRPQHLAKSYDSSAHHIIASAENSLKNLQTDYLDLLLLHRPDPLMDPEAVAHAFERLQREGKVRYFGVSNFTPSQFELLNSYIPLQTNQIECSLLQLNALTDGTLDQALRYKRPPMIWSPLASGALFREDNERIQRIREKLKALATLYQTDESSIALAWLMRHPARLIPVIGSSHLQRYRDAITATTLNLDSDHWHALWSASLGKNIP